MAETILVSRELPLPTIEIGGEPVEFRVDTGGELEEGPRVYLTTALDYTDAAKIARLPSTIGLIASLGVGVEKIDFAAAHARAIQVCNTPTVTEDTADLAFSLILAASRRLGANERFVRSGQWSDDQYFGVMGTRVHAKTLGLVGLGAIGQAVARRARGFDMDILYWNRSAKPDLEAELGLTRIDSLEALVARADIVSLHTALTPQTKHLINAALLAQFKPGAVLVNTGRGGLVDETALVEALNTGQLGAAGLDVFAEEPAVPSALLAYETAVLTPHMGSLTLESRIDFVTQGFANIRQFLQTGTAFNVVRSAIG